MSDEISRRDLLKWSGGALAAHGAGFLSRAAFAAEEGQKPNIVFIMADDQGWGDLGCYGSKQLQTPNMDRLAAEGTRFTDCYSGSAVCAPTRCALMTGLNMGHAYVRNNLEIKPEGQLPIPEDTVTVAKVLKQAGYATGMFGKWGLGGPGSTGEPEKQGFDEFFGYLCQRHAHDYYTDYLWHNTSKVPLDGKTYSHDVIAEAALDFVRRHKDRTFFLYLPFTPPHGKYQVPSDAPYSDKPWPKEVKNYAAMITRLDGTVGRLMALLKELNLDEKTIVFYTSDNGPNKPFLEPLGSAGPFRGIKRELYEGGIRCPMIVRWPGKVPAGKVGQFVWWQVDFFATACELAGIPAPKTDGMSVVPTLLGGEQPPHESLYWEFIRPFQQAVRMGQWKGIRFGTKEPMELYDLSSDPGEKTNIASAHPDVVRKIAAIMDREHTDDPRWPAAERREPPREGQKKKAKGTAK